LLVFVFFLISSLRYWRIKIIFLSKRKIYISWSKQKKFAHTRKIKFKNLLE